jgi:hypothetical protein
VKGIPTAPFIAPIVNQPRKVRDRDSIECYSPSSSLAKWNLSFDGCSGELSVKDFLFRVSHLATTYGVSDYKLRNEICLLLKGVAANWYWLHVRLHPQITWEQLKLDFEKRFKDHRTDYDIRRLIEARRQLPKETIIEFYNALQSLNLQYSTPPPETETLHIMKRNMRPGLQNALAGRVIENIDEFLVLYRTRGFLEANSL